MTCLREEAAAVLVRASSAMQTLVATTTPHVVKELRQHAPGDDLALAAVVDVRGVEERDPALDGAPDDRLGLLLGAAPTGRLSCSPKLIIPRHTRDTRSPVLPRFTYSTPASSRRSTHRSRDTRPHSTKSGRRWRWSSRV